jgi:hypothetical protein
VDANTRPVVGGADEFDAGGLQGLCNRD